MILCCKHCGNCRETNHLAENCDYCGNEIKILKKRLEMTGGIVVLPHSLTKRGEVKIVLHNKCINPVLKELEKK